MDKQPTKQQSQTAAACLARWPGSSHERWAAKRDSILVFIARLGWATRELVNYYFCQTLQSWPARMESEGLLYRQKVVIGDKTVSRGRANGTVATILLLTEKGQKLAREMDGKLGRRIAQPSQLQTRHDLIAMWSACAAVRERTDLMTQSADLEIFSDQVMRQFRDDEHRPDVSIFMVDDNMPRLNIEVERRPKKKGWPEFEFAQKLSRYATSAIETLIVTESEARAQALLAFFQTVRAQGIQEYYFNREAKQWFPFGEDCVKKFDVSATVAIWDQASKQFTSAITFNQ